MITNECIQLFIFPDKLFKSFCLKAGTKKADEIHDYYIKLEELIQEVINMEVAIKDGTLHPFAGPIYNQAGELVVPEGQNADDGMLAGMDFYVQGIDDELPQ